VDKGGATTKISGKGKNLEKLGLTQVRKRRGKTTALCWTNLGKTGDGLRLGPIWKKSSNIRMGKGRGALGAGAICFKQGV